MYTSHFGLTRKPFSLTPDPDYLYLSPRHKKALTILEYGLMSQAGFTVITGDIGSGKTTLINHILDNIGDDFTVGLISNTHAALGELLTWVLAAFGVTTQVENKAQRNQLLVLFLQKLRTKKRRAVLIIDEAQNMSIETLEELRLLSNVNRGADVILQIILVGQPELVKKLKAPELVQFAQRVSVAFHLTPLNYEQTKKYIYHRLTVSGGEEDIFTRSACAAVYYFSGGVPRLINNICDLSLVFTLADDDKNVSLQTIISVVKEKKAAGIIPLMNRQNEERKKIRKLILEFHSIDLEKI